MSETARLRTAKLAALIVRLPEAHPKVLKDLSGWNQEQLNAAIKALQQEQLIEKKAGLFFAPDQYRLAQAAAQNRGGFLFKEKEGSFFEFLSLEEDEKHEAATRVLLELHGRLRSSGREASPALLFHLFLQKLTKLIPDENDSQGKRFFIDLCIDIQPGFYARPDDLQRFLYFLQQARTMAQSLGDRRSELLLHLALGATSLQCRSQAYRPDIRKIMQQGADTVQKLGDMDIMSRVAPYMYSYNFFCGDFQRILGSASFLPVEQAPGNGVNRHIEGTRILFRSSCLAAMGKFSQAVEMLQQSTSSPFLMESDDISLLLRIHLAFLLLASGRMSEARPFIEEARRAIDKDPFDFCHTGVAGAEAYLHYLQGNIQESYAIYLQAARESTQKGTAFWPLYFAPWFLEMCVRYRREGLPALPGKEIDDVLFFQTKGVSRMIQAVAMRLSAENMLFENNGNIEACKDLCQQALAIAQSINTPGETAKLHCLMARLLLREKDRNEARKEAFKAAHARAQTQEAIPWPDELSALGVIPQSNGTLDVKATDNRLARYIKAMLAVNSAGSLDEAYNNIVRISTTELGMDKGGLFALRAGNNELQQLAWHQVNPLDQPLLNFTALQKAVASRPRVIRIQDKDKQGNARFIRACLIPFYCDDNTAYVLFHEVCGPIDETTFMDESFLESIAETLSEVLVNVRRVCAKINEYRVAVSQSGAREEMSGIIYSGPEMETVLRQAQSVAETDAPVLIMGESGVGKELVARYIHRQSKRSGAFIAVNLSSIPGELFESELFGHEKGAFTGAHRSKVGFLELAHQGTVFFDEIGDVSLRFQVKLLRVLQDKHFSRVGGRQSIKSEFRLICATNRNIKALIESGDFREDFFYRICVVPLLVPPLRSRPGDILHLTEHFLKVFARHHNRSIPNRLSVAQANMLLNYSWPGNIRELRNIVERAVILHHGGEVHFSIPTSKSEKRQQPVTLPDIPTWLNQTRPLYPTHLPTNTNTPAHPLRSDMLGPADFFQTLPSLEAVRAYYIRYVLEKTKGIVDGPHGAAEILGLSRASAYKALKKYNIIAKKIRSS